MRKQNMKTAVRCNHIYHNSIPVRYFFRVGRYHYKESSENWVYRSGPVHWIIFSPYLSPCDFLVWSLKRKVVRYFIWLPWRSLVENLKRLHELQIISSKKVRNTQRRFPKILLISESISKIKYTWKSWGQKIRVGS